MAKWKIRHFVVFEGVYPSGDEQKGDIKSSPINEYFGCVVGAATSVVGGSLI